MDTKATSLPKADKYLIDTIIYMASLVSDPKAIDPLLNTVRAVTSKLHFGQPLDKRDRKQLEHVDFMLKDHLLHRDAVQRFTPDALNDKLVEYLGTSTQAPRRRRALREVVIIILLSNVGFGLAAAATPYLEKQNRILAGAVVAMMILYMGIAWMFWSGVRNFSPQLKQAYRLIAVGFIITGMNSVLAPITQMSPAFHQGLLYYGSFMPIFFLSNFPIYEGTRIFARQIGVKSWATSRMLVYGITAIVTIASIFIPHAEQPWELAFDLEMIGTLGMAMLSAASAILALGIAKRTTAMYTRAMRWFCATMALVSLGGIMTGGILLVVGRPEGPSLGMISTFFTATGVVMMTAAYTFKRSSGSR